MILAWAEGASLLGAGSSIEAATARTSGERALTRSPAQGAKHAQGLGMFLNGFGQFLGRDQSVAAAVEFLEQFLTGAEFIWRYGAVFIFVPSAHQAFDHVLRRWPAADLLRQFFFAQCPVFICVPLGKTFLGADEFRRGHFAVFIPVHALDQSLGQSFGLLRTSGTTWTTWATWATWATGATLSTGATASLRGAETGASTTFSWATGAARARTGEFLCRQHAVAVFIEALKHFALRCQVFIDCHFAVAIGIGCLKNPALSRSADLTRALSASLTGARGFLPAHAALNHLLIVRSRSASGARALLTTDSRRAGSVWPSALLGLNVRSDACRCDDQ